MLIYEPHMAWQKIVTSHSGRRSASHGDKSQCVDLNTLKRKRIANRISCVQCSGLNEGFKQLSDSSAQEIPTFGCRMAYDGHARGIYIHTCISGTWYIHGILKRIKLVDQPFQTGNTEGTQVSKPQRLHRLGPDLLLGHAPP